MLVPCINDTTDTTHNSSIDAGNGLFNAFADLPKQSLTDDVNNKSPLRSRRDHHAQNNNKGADLYKAMLMMRTRQRDAYRVVHNTIIANA